MQEWVELNGDEFVVRVVERFPAPEDLVKTTESMLDLYYGDNENEKWSELPDMERMVLRCGVVGKAAMRIAKHYEELALIGQDVFMNELRNHYEGSK